MPNLSCDVSGCHPVSGKGTTKEGGCALAAGTGALTLLLIPGVDIPVGVAWAIWGTAAVTAIVGFVCM
jgi:multidrug transporter EmrE-like cation transporter